VLLIDDDDDYRETLTITLLDAGFEVRSVSSGPAALEHLASGNSPDVILLDWRMPGMNGLEALHELRARGISKPIILLTGFADEAYEDAALAAGAVDFIDKSRRWQILVRRIELIAEAARGNAKRPPQQNSRIIKLGALELRFDINRARWAGQTIDLTLTEFQIVSLLATTRGQDVSYRDIYDIVHGKDFAAGYGPVGYRVNVRSFIKRIRHKFREVHPTFNQIQSYPKFGYRWISEPD
jgi:two-component system response regulator ChvI